MSFHLWFNCDQMDTKVVISINMGEILLFRRKSGIRHFFQNLLGVKIHTSCKILKFCQHFRARKTHVGNIFGIWIFDKDKEKTKLYILPGKKSSWAQIIFIHKSYNEIVVKIVKYSKKQGKMKLYIFWEALSHFCQR